MTSCVEFWIQHWLVTPPEAASAAANALPSVLYPTGGSGLARGLTPGPAGPGVLLLPLILLPSCAAAAAAAVDEAERGLLDALLPG